MKKIFIILSLFVTLSFAKEYKAVFDCYSKDMSYIASRMFLVERTMDMMKKEGADVKFAITIHGGCSPVTSKNYDEIVKQEDLENAKNAQEQLKKLSTLGVDVVVCEISLNANTIDKNDVIKEAKISKNSFIETIAYQNSGYALMLFDK